MIAWKVKAIFETEMELFPSAVARKFGDVAVGSWLIAEVQHTSVMCFKCNVPLESGQIVDCVIPFDEIRF